MTSTTLDFQTHVGPVLEAGPTSDAIIKALSKRHQDIQILDRGSYKRILVPHACVLERILVESFLGHPFQLPKDLENIMPSFKGNFKVDSDQASWSAVVLS